MTGQTVRMTPTDPATYAPAVELRAGVRGYLPGMAAAEFLITSGFIRKAIDIGVVVPPDDPHPATAHKRYLDFSGWRDRAGYLSGGEWAAIELAECLAHGVIADQFFRMGHVGRAAFVSALAGVAT